MESVDVFFEILDFCVYNFNISLKNSQKIDLKLYQNLPLVNSFWYQNIKKYVEIYDKKYKKRMIFLINKYEIDNVVNDNIRSCGRSHVVNLSLIFGLRRLKTMSLFQIMSIFLRGTFNRIYDRINFTFYTKNLIIDTYTYNLVVLAGENQFTVFLKNNNFQLIKVFIILRMGDWNQYEIIDKIDNDFDENVRKIINLNLLNFEDVNKKDIEKLISYGFVLNSKFFPIENYSNARNTDISLEFISALLYGIFFNSNININNLINLNNGSKISKLFQIFYNFVPNKKLYKAALVPTAADFSIILSDNFCKDHNYILRTFDDSKNDEVKIIFFP